MSRTTVLKALLAALLIGSQGATLADNRWVVFYYDQDHRPQVRLDRIRERPEEVRAILALYALENGAGCAGKIPENPDQIDCVLTQALGLKANCSAEHMSHVRAWFDVVPNLTSRWNERRNKFAQKPDALETLCYRAPDTGSWHNIWEIIRVGVSGEVISVEAIQFWGSQHGHGKVRYRHRYKVVDHRVIEISAEVTELQRSTRSMFE